MKYLYLSLFITSSFLFGGGHIVKPIEINTTLPLNSIADKFYEQGDYTQALNSLQTDTIHYADPRLHYLWAKSAEALGKKDEAMFAYERVLILDPYFLDTKNRLAIVYTQTDRESLANELTGRDDRSNLSGIFDISYGYDSNLNANPIQDNLDKYFNVTGSPNEISSSFLRLNGFEKYDYEFGSAWKIETTLNLLYQNTFKDHLYDMSVGNLNFNPIYQYNQFQFKFPLSYATIHYLDTHLMNQYDFSPTLLTTLKENNFLSLQAEISKGDFIATQYQKRDSKTNGVKAIYYYQLNEYDLLSIAYYYQKQEAILSSDERFVDVTFKAIEVYGIFYLYSKLSFSATLLYQKAEYRDDIDTTKIISSDLREDDLYRINAKFDYPLYQDTELYLSDEYTTTNSNYMPAEYDKNTLLVGISMHY